MSSWDRQGKAGRRIHKQRGQPTERRHLGILEHKGDYKKRANIFHNKENLLKSLRKKALDKNPDEFYFHMVRSKMVDGRHHEIKIKKKPSTKVNGKAGSSAALLRSMSQKSSRTKAVPAKPSSTRPAKYVRKR